jgi:hypothetical protein
MDPRDEQDDDDLNGCTGTLVALAFGFMLFSIALCLLLI